MAHADPIGLLMMRWLAAILCTTARCNGAYSTAAPHAAGHAMTPDRCFHAAMLYYSGEASYVPLLRLPLLESAIRLRKRNKWPRKFAAKPWVDSLTELALQEYLDPNISRLNGWWWRYGRHGEKIWTAWDVGDCRFTEGWWSRCIDAPSATWHKTLSPRYEAVRAILDGWRDTGTRMMGPPLVSSLPEDHSGHEKTHRETTRHDGEGRRIPKEVYKMSAIDREIEWYLRGRG